MYHVCTKNIYGCIFFRGKIMVVLKYKYCTVRVYDSQGNFNILRYTNTNIYKKNTTWVLIKKKIKGAFDLLKK